MSKEKLNAQLDGLKGTAKEVAGKVTGNKELETEGAVEKTISKAKEVTADIKDAAEGAVEAVKDAFKK